ncbi:MAG: TIGR04282 family arsenosugar biosynthesis glycosyltransferase [Desulfuromonadales bacterium]|nr:TIGR04282 family arsenosugar biosynthesis glycosyltransferase [Desulfuromonadales bacterium]
MEKVDNLPCPRRVVGVFAKDPVPGEVKTRLSPPLSAEQAAELYQTALGETVSEMRRGPFDLVICYAGGRDYFRNTFSDLPLYPQQGKDLGMRMSNALQHFFRQGYQQAVLIGSDSPDLPLELVVQAFAALDGHSLALAPAHDGGYALIGETCHHPQLFVEMPWSSPDLLAATRQRATAAGIDYQLLPSWDDLDDVAALRRFLQRSPETRTAIYLRSLAVAEGLSAQT